MSNLARIDRCPRSTKTSCFTAKYAIDGCTFFNRTRCCPCGETIPARNLHLIMGAMLAHPRTFIIIGLLRSGLDPAELARQASLF